MTPGRVRFLIVGTARSGTTLLQRLCCELPDVWVPSETHFWPLAAEANERFDFPLHARNRIEMVSWMIDELRTHLTPVQASAVVDAIGRRDQRAGLWVVFESLVAAMSPPVTMLGEKTPGHVAHWELLTSAIHNLKIIGLVRDPHAVLRSQRKVGWGEHDAWAIAERWVAHQRSLEDAARLLGPQRALVIRYEDLVTAPEEHQRSIAEFLGVPAEPIPLEASLVRDYPLFPERETWKSNALEAVTTSQTGGWGDELSPHDLAIIDHVTGPTMMPHGYEAATRHTIPEMEDVSRSAVTAFRHWYASVAAATSLPVT